MDGASETILSSQSRAAFSKRLTISVIFINILVIFLSCLSLLQQRDQIEKSAETATRNICEVLNKNIFGVIKEVDLTLLTVKDEYERQLSGKAVDGRELNSLINRQRGRLPQLDNLRVADSEGIIRYGAGSSSQSPISLSGRDYFTQLREKPNAGLLISKPVLGLISHKWSIIIVRRLNYPDGSFAGVVTGAITLDVFKNMFKAIDLEPGGVIAFRDDRMGLVARYPELGAPGKASGRRLVSGELEKMLAQGQTSGSYFTPAAGSDDIARRLFLEKVGDYPLYIIVGKAQREYLADWRLNIYKIALLLALVALGSAASVWIVHRTGKNEQKIFDLLVEQEQKYRNIFEGAPIGIFQSLAGGRFISANQAAARIFGYDSPEDLLSGIQDIPRQIYAEPQRRAEIMQSLTAGSVIVNEQVEAVRKDGRHIFIDLYLRAARYDNDTPSMLEGFVIDITDNKLAEAEKRQMEAQLLHTQKLESLGVLAGGIAHDFNNILMSIIGNADLALRRLNRESPAVDNLQKIGDAAERAADLAKQMLAYSGKGKFVLEHIHLNKLLEDMLHMLQVSISKKAVLRLNLLPDLPTVEADTTQIRQIVMNLVINASEAIGDRSGVIAITTGSMDCDDNYLKSVWLVENLPAGRYVYLEVADSGCGMDRETMSKIFDPFFTTKFTGRGLGMAAVLGIVRGHKGVIKVYSEPGKGTTFKILLPASGRPVERANDTVPADDWKGSGTVLLVDDEESVRAIGVEMIRELGFRVITANDGKEALEMIRAFPEITVAILDLTMPHMDGEQCFREIRQLAPNVRVIMSSGYNEQDVTQRFLGKGLAGFIQKPYRLSVLMDALRQLSRSPDA